MKKLIAVVCLAMVLLVSPAKAQETAVTIDVPLTFGWDSNNVLIDWQVEIAYSYRYTNAGGGHIYNEGSEWCCGMTDDNGAVSWTDYPPNTWTYRGVVYTLDWVEITQTAGRVFNDTTEHPIHGSPSPTVKAITAGTPVTVNIGTVFVDDWH